jgi:hypothetical protein
MTSLSGRIFVPYENSAMAMVAQTYKATMKLLRKILLRKIVLLRRICTRANAYA